MSVYYMYLLVLVEDYIFVLQKKINKGILDIKFLQINIQGLNLGLPPQHRHQDDAEAVALRKRLPDSPIKYIQKKKKKITNLL